jgi:hypothetical protein
MTADTDASQGRDGEEEDDPSEAFWLHRLLKTFPGAELLDDDDPRALDPGERQLRRPQPKHPRGDPTMTTETDAEQPRATTEAVVDERTGELVPLDVIARPIPLDVISPAPPARDTFAILADAIRLAEVVADTELVPSALRRRPDAVVAVVLKGHELGLSPRPCPP